MPGPVGRVVVDVVGFPQTKGTRAMIQAAQVTTGLVPYIVGTALMWRLQPWLNLYPWNLQGGTATLVMADPNGNQFNVQATVTGYGADAPWVFTGPVGTWTRCWDVTDGSGVRQRSQPEAFVVATSPV